MFLLPYQRAQSTVLFTYTQKENNRIYTFPNGFSVMKTQTASSNVAGQFRLYITLVTIHLKKLIAIKDCKS